VDGKNEVACSERGTMSVQTDSAQGKKGVKRVQKTERVYSFFVHEVQKKETGGNSRKVAGGVEEKKRSL